MTLYVLEEAKDGTLQVNQCTFPFRTYSSAGESLPGEGQEIAFPLP